MAVHYMTQPPPAAHASTKSVEPTPKDKGIIVTCWTWVLERVWTRRYRRYLRGLVQQRYSTIVLGKLNQNDFVQSFDSLTAGILPHFPLEARPVVSDLGKVVEGNLKEVAETTVQESRDDIAIRNAKTQRLQSDLTDKQQRLDRLEDGAVEPPIEDIESLEALYKKQRTLDAKYGSPSLEEK